jgi:hypothetical protein
MVPYRHTPAHAFAGHRPTTAMAVVLALMLTLPVVAPVAAAAPGNDNLANATAVIALPFDAYPDVSQATLEPGEAIGCDNGYGLDQTVWYSWTSQNAGQLTVQIDPTWGGQTAALYGPFNTAPTDVTTVGSPIGCVFYPGPDNALKQSVGAGETYLIQLATVSSWGVSPHLGVSEAIPPSNDTKANAAVIGSLPFAADVDLTLATVEAGEDKCGSGFDRSVWYRYNPTADGTLEIGLSRDQGQVLGGLYIGSDLTITTAGAPGCFSSYGLPTRFVVQGATTYYLQIGDRSWESGSEPVHVSINPGPPLLVESVAINPNVPVSRAGGVATVSFTVTCNNPAGFWVYATLRQRLTRTVVASAFADNGGRCGPTPTVIQLGFADPNHPFVGGSAQVSASIPASDGWSSVQLNPSATLKLKYQR